jgi:hypothetical protein
MNIRMQLVTMTTAQSPVNKHSFAKVNYQFDVCGAIGRTTFLFADASKIDVTADNFI